MLLQLLHCLHIEQKKKKKYTEKSAHKEIVFSSEHDKLDMAESMMNITFTNLFNLNSSKAFLKLEISS